MSSSTSFERVRPRRFVLAPTLARTFTPALGLIAALMFVPVGCSSPDSVTSIESVLRPASRSWPEYLGDGGRNHFSPLSQIDRENVHRLEVAWIHNTADRDEGTHSEMQCNPIVVNGVVYLTSPAMRVLALDGATGERLWSFDPFAEGVRQSQSKSRGVVYWGSGEDRRILVTAGVYLYALDATSGQPVQSFGNGGRVDLREGLPPESRNLFYRVRTPGAVYRDLLIFSAKVGEGPGPAAPGDIRAFDIRTGQSVWTFHTIPRPGEFGYETWPADAYLRTGGANAWGGISVDRERGVVYFGTGSPTYDYWGGNRKGENLFGNSIVALDASTGRRLWHHQVVRHDIWDRDLPAPPNLVQVERNGRRIDALAQVTKSGHVFVLDRETGESIFPLEERRVPASDLVGEEAWPTQLLPTLPPPFTRQLFREEDVTQRTPDAYEAVLVRFRSMRSGEPFLPLSTEPTILMPGATGGGEWGGAAADPESGILYVNANETPWIIQLASMAEIGSEMSAGQNEYVRSCAACHGLDRMGGPARRYPVLLALWARTSRREVEALLDQGKGEMPSFRFASEATKQALLDYLFELDGTPQDYAVHGPGSGGLPPPEIPYAASVYSPFLDHEGYPAIEPPWGTLNAIDLNAGRIRWQVPLGEHPELSAMGILQTGTENLGGPIVTAGGLVFIAATQDERMHAFDKTTGELLWERPLPTGAYATPSTYEVAGRQYVVVAAGGSRFGSKPGDAIVAFALPASEEK
jgi:quinoprotein glucose dehydrogenase